MNPKVKKKWIAALRSGKYKQARNTLKRSNDRMCCLGVLCDLYPKGNGLKWEKRMGKFRFDFEENLLPVSVMQWAGLSQSNPEVALNCGKRLLGALNDNGCKFSTIAELIDKHL